MTTKRRAFGHDVRHKREDHHKPDGVVDSQKVARSQNLETGIAILGTADQVGKGVAIIQQAGDTTRHVQHTQGGNKGGDIKTGDDITADGTHQRAQRERNHRIIQVWG